MTTPSADAIDFTGLIRPGDTVVVGQGCGEPTALAAALVNQRRAIGPLRVFVGALFAGSFAADATDGMDFSGYGAIGGAGALARAGRLDVVPAQYSRLPGLFADGIRIFAAAIPIKIITGFDYPVSIAIMGALSLLYSFYGGLKSVIWIDVLQLIVYLSGGVFIVFQIFYGAPGPVFGDLMEAGKLAVVTLPTSFGDIFFTDYNLIGAVLGGMFLTLASHGTDQLIVQKLLACADLKQARKALI